MKDKKTIGKRVDEVVDKVTENVEIAKDKIAAAKEDASDIARNLSKSVKKAVDDSGAAVSNLIHKKK